MNSRMNEVMGLCSWSLLEYDIRAETEDLRLGEYQENVAACERRRLGGGGGGTY